MNQNQRLQLQSLINEHNVSDQTETIRQIKHSEPLRKEITLLMKIKDECDTIDEVKNKGMNECRLLYNYYTDIFNRIVKDELNVNMMHQFLDILKKIEDNKLDQHEASFQIGTILKEMYIDSAVTRENKMKEKVKEEKKVKSKSSNTKNISWSQYKSMRSNITKKLEELKKDKK